MDSPVNPIEEKVPPIAEAFSKSLMQMTSSQLSGPIPVNSTAHMPPPAPSNRVNITATVGLPPEPTEPSHTSNLPEVSFFSH